MINMLAIDRSDSYSSTCAKLMLPCDATHHRDVISGGTFDRLHVFTGAFCPLFRLHGHRSSAHQVPQTADCGPTNVRFVLIFTVLRLFYDYFATVLRLIWEQGDNEVWNLAKDPDHYDAIEAVMNLRETLRNYVEKINNDTVMTGVPMMRPMFIEFPLDVECFNSTVEAQFMLGPDWLIAPVTTENATTWPAYLPKIPSIPSGTPGEIGYEWVYWWNQTVVKDGQWVSVDTTAIKDFPLFYKRAV